MLSHRNNFNYCSKHHRVGWGEWHRVLDWQKYFLRTGIAHTPCLCWGRTSSLFLRNLGAHPALVCFWPSSAFGGGGANNSVFFRDFLLHSISYRLERHILGRKWIFPDKNARPELGNRNLLQLGRANHRLSQACTAKHANYDTKVLNQILCLCVFDLHQNYLSSTILAAIFR